ncbi:MAG: phosphoribosylglycinamide formyltransferase [Planctomycetes bacterium]|nr:phosphoribosylglycinamide formyltransferase [Planctomycetota bacterium]
MESERPPRLGVLFSGGGRTLENLAREAAQGSLPLEIVVAVSSHREAAGIERARCAGIPTHIVDFRECRQGFSERITGILEEAEVDWIALAGFIRYYDFPERWNGRVLNIHPALLPGFGGKGFYGERVHRAVLESGARFSGCTVHFASREYDSGPIILQRVVPVMDDDTADSLAHRVFEEECKAYPEALRLCISGRAIIEGGRVRIRSEDSVT